MVNVYIAVQFNLSENNAYKYFVKINNLIPKTILQKHLEQIWANILIKQPSSISFQRDQGFLFFHSKHQKVLVTNYKIFKHMK